MTDDNRARWQNVAQAATWLAEGRDVECRTRGYLCWGNLMHGHGKGPSHLMPDIEYRLKQTPPKPREWTLHLGNHNSSVASGPLSQPGIIERVRVREIFE